MNIKTFKIKYLWSLPLFVIILCLFYFYILMPRQSLRSLAYNYIKVSKSIDIVKSKPTKWYVPAKKFNESSILVKTIVISEDWAFFQHFGLDLRQLYHSIKDALFGDDLRGASTITQQVVKNIYFSSKRSYIRKLHELFYALYLERYVSKHKILTLYLNLIELGPNIYGVYDASMYYFGKWPDQLNPREAAFITMLLPSPIKYGESFRSKILTDFARHSIDRLLNKMVLAKLLTRGEREHYLRQSFYWEQGSQKLPVKDNEESSQDLEQMMHLEEEYKKNDEEQEVESE